ncbi:MAG: hypothetical protein AAF430_12775 [Myxococcota bacterium]
MKRMRTLLWVVGLALCWTAPAVAAVDASVVHLRQSCTVGGVVLDDCFETAAALFDLATGWVWNTRTPSPSASNPLLVMVGPGTDFGAFACSGGSHVTVRGSGREISAFDGAVAIDVTDCDQLAFIDIGAHGEDRAVRWRGAGSSSWSNVELRAEGGADPATLAWDDECTTPGETGQHFVHWARVRTLHASGSETLVAPVRTACGELFVYDSELELAAAGGSASLFGGVLNLGGKANLYGTVIRVRATGGLGSNHMWGVFNTTDAEPAFTMHGGIINVLAAASPSTDVTGLFNFAGSVDTKETAFVMKAGSGGTAYRLSSLLNQNQENVQAPFLWEQGAEPPAIESLDGQDLFVETDCDGSGCACSTGCDPHLMVYTSTCTGAGGPWFDTVRKQCRN